LDYDELTMWLTHTGEVVRKWPFGTMRKRWILCNRLRGERRRSDRKKKRKKMV
jgi:hypothetical protein